MTSQIDSVMVHIELFLLLLSFQNFENTRLWLELSEKIDSHKKVLFESN